MADITGKQLNREWKVGALHALYRKNGTWYNLLERFPGVLFDTNGYIPFQTREDFRKNKFTCKAELQVILITFPFAQERLSHADFVKGRLRQTALSQAQA